MAIHQHPKQGTIVICDFNTGFKIPEMQKRRPAIVLNKRLRRRGDLCTIVPLSTTEPTKICDYHHKLIMSNPLPSPYNSSEHWVKADMIYTVAFHRLFLPFRKKHKNGKRKYDIRVIEKEEMIKIQQCVLNAIGILSIDK